MKRRVRFHKWKNPLYKHTDGAYADVESEAFDNKAIVRYSAFGVDVYKVDQNTNSFNMWVMETNFDLGIDELNLIDDMPGIEIIEPFSAYRARICIGNCFDGKSVRRSIREALCETPPNLPLSKANMANIEKDMVDLKLAERPWLIYVLPNGNHEPHSCDSKEDFNKLYSQYNEVRQVIGGLLLTGGV